MREDFEISIVIKKGIYLDVFGKEYRMDRTIRNIETNTLNVILIDLETKEEITCSVEHFTSPFLTADEELLTRFRIKKEEG